MEACNGVERELNNVQEKLNKFANAEGEHMANIIREVKAAKEELDNGNQIQINLITLLNIIIMKSF